MPTYSYKCTECGTAFDIQQAFTDNSLTECPNCGGKLRKVFSAIGVTFNGSGFYRNDSREKKGAGAASGSAPKSDSSSSSSDSSSSPAKSADPKPSPAAKSTPAASTPAAG
ncbi:MAG TPA: FmdB family zinc ribbon protein [Galbitalea sp.]